MTSAQTIPPLLTEAVAIDDFCVGERWTIQDHKHLAMLVALVAMGQAYHAARILNGLAPRGAAFTTEELVAEARVTLTVQEDKTIKPRIGYPRPQRDGFIFEAISWMA